MTKKGRAIRQSVEKWCFPTYHPFPTSADEGEIIQLWEQFIDEKVDTIIGISLREFEKFKDSTQAASKEEIDDRIEKSVGDHHIIYSEESADHHTYAEESADSCSEIEQDEEYAELSVRHPSSQQKKNFLIHEDHYEWDEYSGNYDEMVSLILRWNSSGSPWLNRIFVSYYNWRRNTKCINDFF